MKFLIREAKTKDAEAIAELSTQLGYKSTIAMLQNRLATVLTHPDNCVFVALDNEEIVGWIHGFYSLRIESDPFVEIGGLIVSEKYRGVGIGKSLIEMVSKWSDSKNCPKTTVRCNIIREKAHAFYEKMGFILIKEQKVFNKTED